MKKKRIIFVCIHNSARSQMAEAFMNRICGDEFTAESAGLEPGVLNPLVVKAMEEAGIDISGHRTKSVSGMIESGRVFDYVITVCDEASAERCPVFPGSAKRLHWGFPDPSSLRGTPEEKLERTRIIRDAIEAQIAAWCEATCGETAAR